MNTISTSSKNGTGNGSANGISPIDFGAVEIVSGPGSFYHGNGGARGQYVDSTVKEFIAWDGEGQNLNGPKAPQSYVLFGNSKGRKITSTDNRGLTTFDIIDFAVDCKLDYPAAINVGFGFNYDFNMFLTSLNVPQCKELWKNSGLRFRNQHTGTWYGIRFAAGKWVSLTRYHEDWHPKNNPNARDSIRFQDIFGFFQSRFTDAVIEMLGCTYTTKFCGEKCEGKCIPGMDKVIAGKKHRGGAGYCPECKSSVCPFDDIEYVKEYWDTEVRLMAEVAERFRKSLYKVGLNVTSWYGGGALGSYLHKTHNTKRYMKAARMPVQTAAQYAYAGGRFELFKIGRANQTIYSKDIRSAYPDAIRRLPCLAHGEWRYVKGEPESIAEFGMYHVEFDGVPRTMRGDPFPYMSNMGPVFYRDEHHDVSFPMIAKGWYHSPEVSNLVSPYWGYRDKVRILEGWEFIPGCDEEPFAWVPEMYERRRELKDAGRPEQYGLKIGINSVYGKMAQRVGYNAKTKRIPPYHQLEWAGWVTSYVRGKLFICLKSIPAKDIIAIETDGVYTLSPIPDEVAPVSKELGDFEADTYDEAIYLQSGMAYLRKGDKWTAKRRGLDADTFKLEQVVEFTQKCHGGDTWPEYTGSETRFMTLGAALANPYTFNDNHRVWKTNPEKKIAIGRSGKRVHAPNCRACRRGESAYDALHDTVVHSLASLGKMSTKHHIPWLAKDSGDVEPDWMQAKTISNEMAGI